MNSFNSWLKTAALFGHHNPTPPEDTHKDEIQLALLLDTSNSMDGLIEQAKSQLWNIVNELSRTDRAGESPNLKIALYEYGNSGLWHKTGYIKQVSPFTSDMDMISEKLFALSTNGGDEYCGQAIQTSLNQLRWTGSDNGLRLIYIAGNEPFSQGPIPYKQACQLAVNKDVVVNTIFCGAHETGIASGWKSGALLTGGEYYSIDHNAATVYIDSPYDKEIEELNEKLNKTYVPYGADGAASMQNLRIQDTNAESYSKANKVDRAVFKSSKKYSNEKWDLVDAYQKDKKIINKKKDLPAAYQDLDEKEVETIILNFQAEREDLQTQIQNLDKKRRVYLKENAKVNADSTNLEYSIKNSLKKQAKKKGYKIKE